jgi:hypothetical protein
MVDDMTHVRITSAQITKQTGYELLLFDTRKKLDEQTYIIVFRSIGNLDGSSVADANSTAKIFLFGYVIRKVGQDETQVVCISQLSSELARLEVSYNQTRKLKSLIEQLYSQQDPRKTGKVESVISSTASMLKKAKEAGGAWKGYLFSASPTSALDSSPKLPERPMELQSLSKENSKTVISDIDVDHKRRLSESTCDSLYSIGDVNDSKAEDLKREESVKSVASSLAPVIIDSQNCSIQSSSGITEFQITPRGAYQLAIPAETFMAAGKAKIDFSSGMDSYQMKFFVYLRTENELPCHRSNDGFLLIGPIVTSGPNYKVSVAVDYKEAYGESSLLLIWQNLGSAPKPLSVNVDLASNEPPGIHCDIFISRKSEVPVSVFVVEGDERYLQYLFDTGSLDVYFGIDHESSGVSKEGKSQILAMTKHNSSKLPISGVMPTIKGPGSYSFRFSNNSALTSKKVRFELKYN